MDRRKSNYLLLLCSFSSCTMYHVRMWSTPRRTSDRLYRNTWHQSNRITTHISQNFFTPSFPILNGYSHLIGHGHCSEIYVILTTHIGRMNVITEAKKTVESCLYESRFHIDINKQINVGFKWMVYSIRQRLSCPCYYFHVCVVSTISTYNLIEATGKFCAD